MHDQIQEAFDGIKASEALKARTHSFVAEQTERRQRLFFPAAPAARWIAAAACALLLILGGWRLYEAPTVAISVDINPSIELEVNRFGRVVSVSGYNEAGEALLERLPLRNKPYAEAIEAIASDSQIRSLLENDEMLVFFVSGAENAQTSQILSDIESFAAGRQNMVCRCGDEEIAREARAQGLSCGRYAAYLEWKAAGAKNPTAPGAITVESQENDPASLLNWTRSLIALRKATPAFWADSAFEPVFNEQKPYPMVYTRSDGTSTYIVALNPTGVKQTVVVPATPDLKRGATLPPVLSYGKVSLRATGRGDILTMGPTSVYIAKVR